MPGKICFLILFSCLSLLFIRQRKQDSKILRRGAITNTKSTRAVRIIARRTVIEDENASKHDSYGGDERTQIINRHSEMTFEWILNSDTVVVNDDPGNLHLIAYGDPMSHTKGSHPLKGTGTSNWQFNSEEKDILEGCTNLRKKNGQFSASGNLKDAGFSFTYDPTKDDGEFSLDAHYNHATGQGVEHIENSGTCHDPSGNFDRSEMGAAEMDMLDIHFGQFTARNKPVASLWGDMSSYGAEAEKAAKAGQEALEEAGLGGYCTIKHQSQCGGNYEITYKNSKVFNKLQEGWTGSSTRTVNTEVDILIVGKQKQYDAIIEPFAVAGASDNYEKWIPQGPRLDSNDKIITEKGNSISFRVYIVDKANPDKPDPDVKYDVEYSLIKGSEEPGYCNNFPLENPDKKWDLRFDSTMKNMPGVGFFSNTLVKSAHLEGKSVMPVITSYDYGSFAKLKTKVVLECGQELEAHFKKDPIKEIPIPMDKNDNQIADQWEKEMGISGLSDAWDEDTSTDNDHNGDGLTLYEEYRGIVAKGKFIRLDPHKKELFVLNHIGNQAQPGFDLFYKASGIKVIELSDKDIDKYDLVVNINSVFAKLGKQHALLLKDYHTSDATTAGYTINHAHNRNVPTSPGDCEFVGINLSYPFKRTDMAVTIAHEMAHGCGVSHHGDAHPLNPPDKSKIDSSYRFYGNNMLLVSFQNIEPIIKQGLLGDIAGPGSESSGDMYCIMCYSNEYVWAAPKGTEGKIYINVDGYADDCPKTRFCDSKAGTFLNDEKHLPYPVYGDATTGGDCIHQFQVKDWH